MVVRHQQIEFASGALVFPGGKVEPEDHALAGGDEEMAARSPRSAKPMRNAACC